MKYGIVIRHKSAEFLNDLDEKSRRIITARLAMLKDDPFPGKGGDKELLKSPNSRQEEHVYRLHIGRRFPAFYVVLDTTVDITEVMTIEQAHKKYGTL